MNEEGPATLIDAVTYFADLKVCHDYMVGIKWPDGKIVCPKCGGDQIGKIETRSLDSQRLTRGYALKCAIDGNVALHRDWGGYGIIAPDLTSD